MFKAMCVEKGSVLYRFYVLYLVDFFQKRIYFV